MTEIQNGKKIIKTPISEEDIKGLRAGEAFYLSGEMLTGRDDVHKRVVSEGEAFPAELRGKALFHAGPIVRDAEGGGYEIVSIGPTTSMRMEGFEYDFIKKTGVPIIIGKGGMGPDTARACREYNAIHCAAPAGCAVIGATSVEKVSGVDWLDLGMPEAIWHLRVKDFGPLIVTIDSSGNNYFEEKKDHYRRIKEQIAPELTDKFKTLK